MYKLKDGLYAAKYKPQHKDDSGELYTRYYSVFLIKDGKVLLWDNGDYSIALEAFSLKGQDYVWVEEFTYATSFTDLYKLDDKLTGIYHSMFTGD